MHVSPDEAEEIGARDPDVTIAVLNKVDLLPEPARGEVLGGDGGVRGHLCRLELGLDPAARTCAVSAATGQGMEGLVAALVHTVRARRLALQNDALVAINQRHGEALLVARQALADFLADVQAGEPPEILAADLRRAVAALGEISGEQVSEAVLDSIFARFCIGK